MKYQQALTHAGLIPDVRYHQLYLQGVSAGMAQAREAMTIGLDALESCGAAHITDGGNQWHDEKLVDNAITKLKDALDGKAVV